MKFHYETAEVEVRCMRQFSHAGSKYKFAPIRSERYVVDNFDQSASASVWQRL